MIITYLMKNMGFYTDRMANLIYCDYMYGNKDLSWVRHYWNFLVDNGIFIAQTDDATIAEVKLELDSMPNAQKINICIYKQEWGGVPRKGFPNKHDYILIYSNGNDWKWYPDRIQIPKKMIGKGFNPSGRLTKTPCTVFDDLGNFSTMSKERVKGADGRNIQYQKPMKLFDRVLLPFTDENDLIIDPFMGSGSVGRWCIDNKRDYIGIEYNASVYNIAVSTLNSGEGKDPGF